MSEEGKVPSIIRLPQKSTSIRDTIAGDVLTYPSPSVRFRWPRRVLSHRWLLILPTNWFTAVQRDVLRSPPARCVCTSNHVSAAALLSPVISSRANSLPRQPHDNTLDTELFPRFFVPHCWWGQMNQHRLTRASNIVNGFRGLLVV